MEIELWEKSDIKNSDMKNSRICPKCGSNEIVVVDGFAGAYGTGNNIMVGVTIFSAVKVDRYVCCDCGFSEEWIRNEDIDRLKNSNKVHK